MESESTKAKKTLKASRKEAERLAKASRVAKALEKASKKPKINEIEQAVYIQPEVTTQIIQDDIVIENQQPNDYKEDQDDSSSLHGLSSDEKDENVKKSNYNLNDQEKKEVFVEEVVQLETKEEKYFNLSLSFIGFVFLTFILSLFVYFLKFKKNHSKN
ncbi:MAG: hypothetical protein AM1032_000221 [Mycoplasmataceae bacterium]|nr:MAG: hypothetical protein AM1032_000221 [Mycoplasmataceae bacterium]